MNDASPFAARAPGERVSAADIGRYASSVSKEAATYTTRLDHYERRRPRMRRQMSVRTAGGSIAVTTIMNRFDLVSASLISAHPC